MLQTLQCRLALPPFDHHRGMQTCFTLLCLLLAVIAWYLDSATVHRFASVRATTWCLISASIFPTARLCSLLVDASIRLLELIFSGFDNIHYILIGTSSGLRSAALLPRTLTLVPL